MELGDLTACLKLPHSHGRLVTALNIHTNTSYIFGEIYVVSLMKNAHLSLNPIYVQHVIVRQVCTYMAV